MSIDLILQPSCSGCQSTAELYGSTCKHLTLCVTCGKTMAENRLKCRECGTPITRLIREYNVRACSSSDKNYFIGRFITGLPNFSKKKSENKWSLQKEGLQGRQVTDTLREKFKNKPWLLEDETGTQYHGHMEGAQSTTYYLLMLQGKEFVAIPAGSWYNFNKVAQYKQLTLEEAEEKMKNRRRTADGYERWMMKAANNGPAAFGGVENIDEKEVGTGGGGRGGRKKAGGDDDETNASDRGEEDEEEEAARKNRLGLNKKAGDDDEEGPRGGDFDLDDDIEKGDDWEHEEIFTDDDEASAIHPEEREDLAPEIPAPPEIKNDDEDEEECDEENGGGLSNSGKELKKLLGRTNGLNDSDAEDEDDDEEDLEDDISPVLAPKHKETVKDEPTESSPLKSVASGSARGTPSTSKTAAKGKRKVSEEAKTTNGAPLKKVKSQNEVKPVKNESPSASTKISAAPKVVPQQPSSKVVSPPSTGPVTEDEIRAVLLQNGPVTTQDLVSTFKSRLKSKEDKAAFAAILRRISKIQKTSGPNYVVLRDR